MKSQKSYRYRLFIRKQRIKRLLLSSIIFSVLTLPNYAQDQRYTKAHTYLRGKLKTMQYLIHHNVSYGGGVSMVDGENLTYTFSHIFGGKGWTYHGGAKLRLSNVISANLTLNVWYPGMPPKERAPGPTSYETKIDFKADDFSSFDEEKLRQRFKWIFTSGKYKLSDLSITCKITFRNSNNYYADHGAIEEISQTNTRNRGTIKEPGAFPHIFDLYTQPMKLADINKLFKAVDIVTDHFRSAEDF